MIVAPVFPSATAPSEDELTAGCEQYHTVLGWPVTVDLPRDRLVLSVGGVVDAILMPVDFGQRVHAALQVAMLAGPVIAGPGPNWWTFLAEPAKVPDLPDALRNRHVRMIPRGATVVVPCVPKPGASPRWVTAPGSGRSLPEFWTVINAARRIAHGATS
jgi:hypothetical protein